MNIDDLTIKQLRELKSVICKSDTSFDVSDKQYFIVRTYSAGVFAGYIESRNGQEVIMRQARRLWYWKGASSLSQLAVDGVMCPDECKFPCEVDRVHLLQAIEILEVSDKAKRSIQAVKVWEQK